MEDEGPGPNEVGSTGRPDRGIPLIGTLTLVGSGIDSPPPPSPTHTGTVRLPCNRESWWSYPGYRGLGRVRLGLCGRPLGSPLRVVPRPLPIVRDPTRHHGSRCAVPGPGSSKQTNVSKGGLVRTVVSTGPGTFPHTCYSSSKVGVDLTYPPGPRAVHDSFPYTPTTTGPDRVTHGGDTPSAYGVLVPREVRVPTS